MAAAVNAAPSNTVRRTTLLLLSVCAAVMLSCAAALALNAIQCKTNQTCRGTDGRDLMKGTVGPNDVFARSGGDTLKSFGGEDSLLGQKGNDKLLGGDLDDALFPGPGNDASNGGEGEDGYRFDANWGTDTITDTSILDADPRTGNYLALGINVRSNVTISLASDSGPAPEMRDESGANTVNWSGNVVDNVVSDSPGEDTIDGNPSTNNIFVRGGANEIFAGGGNDLIDVRDTAGGGDPDGDFVDCGEGNDTVVRHGPTTTSLGDRVIDC